jgi:hypothetical protein
MGSTFGRTPKGDVVVVNNRIKSLPEGVRSERELVKMLVDVGRGKGADTEAENREIKDKLISIRMRAHIGRSAVERDLWLALYSQELSMTEAAGRKFEDSNFRRRIEALGMMNAAIESVLYLRMRASSKLKGVCLDHVVLLHPDVFGEHLCELARKNLEMRALLTALPDDVDDE